MTFTMPVLVDVISARYSSPGNPAEESVRIDYVTVATNYCGNPEPELIPYTRDVSEEWLPDGSLYMLGLEIDSWLLSHPDFVIQPYEAPEPTPEMTPAEKFAAATGLSIEDLRALVKE